MLEHDWWKGDSKATLIDGHNCGFGNPTNIQPFFKLRNEIEEGLEEMFINK